MEGGLIVDKVVKGGERGQKRRQRERERDVVRTKAPTNGLEHL